MTAAMYPPMPAAPQPREPKGGLATLVVLLIMVGIVAGGFVAQNAVADEPPKPIAVGLGVSITPPPDWEFGGRSEDVNTILLSQGSGSLAITVVDGTEVRAALEALRDEWLAGGTVSASDIGEVADVRPGQAGLRFAYSGTFEDVGTPRSTAVEGEVTGVSGTGVTVLFDGWAGLGDYVAVSAEIATMIRETVIP
jgi:hypothetical protein